MKWKLSAAEFTALYNILQCGTVLLTPHGIEARVVHGVLFRLYKKFYRKAIEVKKKYSISVDDDEACAFHMFFTRNEIKMDHHTSNTVLQLTNLIHQKYST